jgi:Family of unknown function (DUF6884)
VSAPDVVLVGCTKSKRAARCPARDMYDPSDLFRLRRAYAEASGCPWAILSARLGVIGPEREIDPYDFTIAQRRAKDWVPKAWANAVLQACFLLAGRETVMGPGGFLTWADPSLTVEIHASIDYVRIVELGVVDHYRQVTLTCPTEGLGIGHQKQWYRRRASPTLFGER